jgi:hypothetical protein
MSPCRRSLPLVVALAVVLLPLPVTSPAREAAAASYVEKTFTDLVDEADEIFVGQVADKTSRRGPGGLIVTDVAIAPLQRLKGAIPDDRVIVTVLGGTVGDQTLAVAAFPVLDKGRTYVLFVKENGQSILPLVGGAQGLFGIRWGLDGRPMVFDARDRGVDAGFLLGGRVEGPAAPLTLDEFVAAITARVGR